MVITLEDHLELLTDDYLPVVDQFVFPVLAQKPNGKFVQFGTGYGLEIESKRYIATAEHVIRNISNFGSEIYIATGKLNSSGTIYKLGTSSLWNCHHDKEKDIALCYLDDHLQKVSTFPLSKRVRSYSNSMKGRFFVAGYPNSKNKEFKLNKSQALKITNIQPLLVKLDSEINFDADGMNNEFHFGFSYNKVASGGNGFQKGGKLDGFSGSPVWYFPRELDANSMLLVGTLIEWHSKSKIAYSTYAKYFEDLI